MGEFVTFFEGFFNDYKDFLSRPDKYLTMGGRAKQSAMLEDRYAKRPLRLRQDL